MSLAVDLTYTALRVVSGFLFWMHGAQKVFGLFGGAAQPIASQMGVAGIIEFTGGLLLMLGLLARVVAFIASGEMAVAYALAHASRGGWPIQNGGELAVVFCFLFLFIAAKGSGRWSLDAWVHRRRRVGTRLLQIG